MVSAPGFNYSSRPHIQLEQFLDRLDLSHLCTHVVLVLAPVLTEFGFLVLIRYICHRHPFKAPCGERIIMYFYLLYKRTLRKFDQGTVLQSHI